MTLGKQRRVIDEEGNHYQAIVPSTSIIPRSADPGDFDDDCFEEVGIDGTSSDKLSTGTRHSDSAVFMCKPCQIYFPLKPMLDKHMNTMHPKSPANSANLQKPKKLLQKLNTQVNDGTKYECSFCPYMASHRKYVIAHELRMHVHLINRAKLRLREKQQQQQQQLQQQQQQLQQQPRKKTIRIALKSQSMTVAVVGSGKKQPPKEKTVPEVIVEPEIPSEVIDADEEEAADPITTDMNVEPATIEEVPEEFAPEISETIVYGGTEVVTEVEDDLGKKFACPYCKFLTPSRSTIHSHITRKHPDEWSSTVERRMKKSCIEKSALKDIIHPCFFCEFIAPTRPILGMHTRREHKDRVLRPRRARLTVELKCDQCDFSTYDKRKIQMHIDRKHTTELRFPCQYCGKRFKVKCDLTSHIRFQHFKVPCQCDVCGKICSNSNSLHVHQKREHYKPEFECHICHRRVVSQENLDEHILRQHEQPQDYMCEQCGKIFRQAGKLKQHMMTHTGEKPHKCQFCGRAFARRAVFRQHLLIHTGQKPYVCDICGKGFTQKPGLICHRKSHPGNHPPLPVVYIDHILTEFTKRKEDEIEDELKEEEEAEVEEQEFEEIVEEDGIIQEPMIVLDMNGEYVELVEQETVQDSVY